jgi:protease IV
MPEPEKKRNPWIIIAVVLFLLAVFSFGFVGCVAVFIADDGSIGLGNVAVIPVKGVIVVDGDNSIFGTTGYAISGDIVEQIEKAEEDSLIQGIVLDINSPGGSPVASAEIARAIEESTKPVVGVVREVGASGAYWVAASTDHIIANEVSVVGSIGVIASYLQFGDLISQYNVSYEQFIAGEHKDMGTPYRKMTEIEKAKYQHILDLMHDVFIREVAEGRGLDEAYVRDLATGEIFLGIDALNYGLIDQLGGKQEAYDYMENVLGVEIEPVDFETEKGFFELLVGAMDNSAYNVGTGIGSVLVADDSGIKV